MGGTDLLTSGGADLVLQLGKGLKYLFICLHKRHKFASHEGTDLLP